MNKFFTLILVLFSLVGCTLGHNSPQTLTTAESGSEVKSVNEKPKARIAVARFRDKTAAGHHWWNPKIGDGMADQLIAALLQSQRFIIPNQDNSTSAVEEAELLIIADVTEFGDGTATNRKSGNGVLDAIGGAVKTSQITIDLRIIDSRTANTLAETSIQGQSNNINLGAAIGEYFNGGDLAGALGKWKGTPTEQAFLATVNEAVSFAISKTPEQYFHFARLQTVPLAPRFVTVSADKLNIRSGAGIQFKIINAAKKGDSLLVLDINEKWLYVKTAKGETGWAARWLTQSEPELGTALNQPGF